MITCFAHSIPSFETHNSEREAPTFPNMGSILLAWRLNGVETLVRRITARLASS